MLNPKTKERLRMLKSIARDLNCHVITLKLFFIQVYKDNIVAGTFIRVYCLAVNTSTLYQLHN